MKNTLAVFLLFVICFSFVSCGGSEAVSDNSDILSSQSTDVVSVDESNVSSDVSREINSSSDEASEIPSTESSSDISKEADTSEETEEKGSTPLLYKVSDDNGNVMWLLGSIHVGKADFYPLPDYVTNAFNSADAVAVEFDFVEFQQDQEAIFNAITLMFYTDGTKITDHISEELYLEAKRIMEENDSYNMAYDFYMPCFWNHLVINNLTKNKYSVSSENGVDDYIINMAKELSKEIIDIESPNLQYSLLANFSDDLQEFLLKDAVDSYNTGKGIEDLDNLMELWKQGDEEQFSAAVLKDNTFGESNSELYGEYYTKLTLERSAAMAEFAENTLNSGKEVFVCVGAAHVVGDNGMVGLLAKKGYTVEKVSA